MYKLFIFGGPDIRLNATFYLRARSRIALSFYNQRHFSTFLQMLIKRWPDRPKKPLRFFFISYSSGGLYPVISYFGDRLGQSHGVINLYMSVWLISFLKKHCTKRCNPCWMLEKLIWKGCKFENWNIEGIINIFARLQ